MKNARHFASFTFSSYFVLLCFIEFAFLFFFSLSLSSSETNINLHEFDFEQMLMMPPPPLPLTESNNTNDSGSSTTSSTHNEDEDELNTTSSHNETDEYFVKKNLQINLVNAQCMLDTKMDILQEERSINGDFLAAPHHNDDQNDTASNQSSDAQMSPTPNNLGINSSKTTSSVSSSTSISSSHAESVEETTTPLPVLDCNPNEPHPQVHANLEQESLINFEPATTNNNSISIETNDRFAFFCMNFILFFFCLKELRFIDSIFV